VWFAEDYDAASFHVEAPLRDIRPGQNVAAVGTLIDAPHEPVRIMVTDSLGVRVVAGDITPPAPANVRMAQATVVGCVLRGATLPGRYVVTFEGHSGRALAEGAFDVVPDPAAR